MSSSVTAAACTSPARTATSPGSSKQPTAGTVFPGRDRRHARRGAGPSCSSPPGARGLPPGRDHRRAGVEAIRVVCATHRDLEPVRQRGEAPGGDLYARLNEHVRQLPALREREVEDIYQLARSFAGALQAGRASQFTFSFLVALLHYARLAVQCARHSRAATSEGWRSSAQRQVGRAARYRQQAPRSDRRGDEVVRRADARARYPAFCRQASARSRKLRRKPSSFAVVPRPPRPSSASS